MINKIKDSVLLDVLFLLCQIACVIGLGTGMMFVMYQIYNLIKFLVS